MTMMVMLSVMEKRYFDVIQLHGCISSIDH